MMARRSTSANSMAIAEQLKSRSSPTGSPGAISEAASSVVDASIRANRSPYVARSSSLTTHSRSIHAAKRSFKK
jgi:hypothetical protein